MPMYLFYLGTELGLTGYHYCVDLKRIRSALSHVCVKVVLLSPKLRYVHSYDLHVKCLWVV